ncbi:MAG: leucyl/phenylalanyl-tRNA--protein transferase [Pseudomonadota bacterium]|nr:leucyl/phenylalanyl-tRNA--protein transferase [Pseudomonadota bacterium]
MLCWIDDAAPLPAPEQALGPDSDAPGLVAAGGRVNAQRLDEAYRKGIFPWFSAGQPVLWWSPDPRMVLPTTSFRLSHSLRKTLRRFLRSPHHTIRFDSAFSQVIAGCAGTAREGQDGTWIVPAIVEAYTEWHRLGHVHSAETWIDGELAGGLYFVSIGGMVYGESMFTRRADASKLALAALVAACLARGIALIDCQQNTAHLASLGGHEMPRSAFLAHVESALTATAPADWFYDPRAFALIEGLGPNPNGSEYA